MTVCMHLTAHMHRDLCIVFALKLVVIVLMRQSCISRAHLHASACDGTAGTLRD